MIHQVGRMRASREAWPHLPSPSGSYLPSGRRRRRLRLVWRLVWRPSGSGVSFVRSSLWCAVAVAMIAVAQLSARGFVAVVPSAHRQHQQRQHQQLWSKFFSKLSPCWDEEVAVGGGAAPRRLRPLRRSDLSEVLRVAVEEFRPVEPNENLSESLERLVSSVCMRAGFAMRIAHPEHSVLCITEGEDEKLLGVAEVSLQPADGRTCSMFPLPQGLKHFLLHLMGSSRDTCQPYISNVLVDYGARRQGLGSLLMASCEAQARAWGYSAVYLHTELDSEEALSLYRRRGYECVGETVDSSFWWEDQVSLSYMRKDLR